MDQFKHTDSIGNELEVNVHTDQDGISAVLWIRDHKGKLTHVVLRTEAFAEFEKFITAGGL